MSAEISPTRRARPRRRPQWLVLPFALPFALLGAVTAIAPAAAAAPVQSHAKAKLYARADGDDVKVAIEIRIDRGYHLYHGPEMTDLGAPAADGTTVVGAPTSVSMEGAGFEWSAPRFPPPEVEPAAYGPPANVHYGTLLLWLRGKKGEGADVAALAATLSGLTCDAQGCVPYGETVKSSGEGSDKLFANFPADLVVAAAAVPDDSGMASHAHASFYVRADGDDVKAAVRIEIDPGFHVGHGPTDTDAGGPDSYAMPTTLELLGDGFEWSAPRFPAPKREDVTFGETKTWIHVHEGAPVVYLRGTRKSATADPAALQAKLHGQTCDEKGCVPYDETVKSLGPGPDALFAAFPTDLVAGASGVVAPGGVAPTNGGSVSADSLQSMSLGAFLLTAIAYGLIALLMPCTYPMIPITVSYFTKQATARHTSLAPLALCYGIGIVVMFTLIGVLVGEVIVHVAFHWATNLLFGLIFVAFGLSMIGVFLLQPPQFLLNLSTKATRKGGLGGVFLMGATLVVTSFTCTGPFVGNLLAIGGSGGDRSRVALGMAVFGLTMAVPFVALAMLPGKVKQLPKSGEWTHTLKVTLGFVEIAAALKFFSNVDVGLQAGVFPRELFLALVAGVFVLTAVYLFGMIRLDEENHPVTIAPGAVVKLHSSVSPKRLMAGIVFLLFGVYCAYGALGNRMDRVMQSLAPPYHGWLPRGDEGAAGVDGAATDAGPVIVKDDLDAAVALATKHGKLVLLNFTGFQ